MERSQCTDSNIDHRKIIEAGVSNQRDSPSGASTFSPILRNSHSIVFPAVAVRDAI